MSRRFPLRALCFAFLLCVGSTIHAATTGNSGFTFAALGDTPYYDHEESAFIALIAEMNREPLAFAIHVGDFKSGQSACSNELFLQRRQWFDLLRHPLVYTPGDNEWTDCWRPYTGRYDPIERLGKLREIFFSKPMSLGQRPIALLRQADVSPQHSYPEHARWTHEGVLFATLNVPGSDNNFSRDRAEFAVREPAVLDWIKEAFAVARKQRLDAVVVAMQANPWLITGPRRRAFTRFFETLRKETLRFHGEVVLIHGDTHRYRVDQPLIDPETQRPIRNFRRIEVFGSPSVNWVRVRVERADGRVAFVATPGS